MHQTRAPQRTIVELIDALEAEIAAIQGRGDRPPAVGGESVTPAILRAEMDRAAVNTAELAKAAGVRCEDLDDWISGRTAIPDWILTATRLLALLTPSARRKAVTGSWNGRREHPNRTHPFSRIEEL